jgi:hypothetical protein
VYLPDVRITIKTIETIVDPVAGRLQQWPWSDPRKGWRDVDPAVVVSVTNSFRTEKSNMGTTKKKQNNDPRFYRVESQLQCSIAQILIDNDRAIQLPFAQRRIHS